MGVAGQQFFAVPDRQRRGVGVHTSGGGIAQAVVVTQMVGADPMRGGGAAIAAIGVHAARKFGLHRCLRQGFAAVVADGFCIHGRLGLHCVGGGGIAHRWAQLRGQLAFGHAPAQAPCLTAGRLQLQ